jgi:predicted secreted Zn-dependent protease
LVLIAAWLLAFKAAAASKESQPEVELLTSIPNLEVRYYTISGVTEQEIRAQLDTLGPTDQFGRRCEAYSFWEINWEWPTLSNGLPDLTRTKSSYYISVTLPAWIPRDKPNSQAQSDLTSAWNRFFLGLVRHERRHVQIVLDNYKTIEREIRKTAALQPDLTSLQASAIGQRLLREIRTIDKEYDQSSARGRKEGIHFP